MKTACKTLAIWRLFTSVFALGIALPGVCWAAQEPFLGVPGAVAKSSNEVASSQPMQMRDSSSVTPSSGSAAVPSHSSSLASPSLALSLPTPSSTPPLPPVSGSQPGAASTSLVPSSSLPSAPIVPGLGSPPLGSPSLGVAAAVKDDAKKDDAKSLNAIESRVSDSVKDVVKHLGAMTETATLEDINVARQAVAKLEALIDVERRLSELEKVRNERSRGPGASSAMAAAIPASALLPLPEAKPFSMLKPLDGSGAIKSPGPDLSMPKYSAPVPPAPSSELLRVIGSNGRYRAILKAGDGEEKTYRVGDKLSDGSVIQNITRTSLDLKRDGKKSTLRVKGVDMVFNGK